MAQQVYDLGPVCPIYKGNWSATASYETLNMVRHGTALWVMIAKTYTVGSTPSDSSTFWKKAAQDGATGAKGATGATGATGPRGPEGTMPTYYDYAVQSLSGAMSIGVDAPIVLNRNTSGGVTFTASALARNISKLVTLNLYASAATTITWPAVKWIDKNGSAPAWGTAGAYLTVELWFTNGRILASTIYNSQE